MNKYKELKQKHQTEINNLPLKYAFGQKQFDKMLEEFQLTVDKLYHIGSGAYCAKTDFKMIEETFQRQDKELKDSLEKDKEMLYSAIRYEMANHEYCISYDDEIVLSVLGFTFEDFEKNEERIKIYLKAKEDYLKQYD